MGSTSSCTKCPQCGNEWADCTSYYKTGEYYLFCPLCGYHYQHYYQTDENDNWIMLTDVYEVDGKTVGYAVPKEVDGVWVLSNFTPLSLPLTQEAIDTPPKGTRLVKLGETLEECRDLTFWFDRKIILGEDGKTYLHHTHPIVEDVEDKGKGVCWLGSEKHIELYQLEEIGLKVAFEEVQKPECREHSYITIYRDGRLELAFGTAKLNGAPITKSRSMEEPVYALNDLKEAYYLIQSVQHELDVLCSDLFGEEEIASEKVDEWRKNGNQGEQIHDGYLKSLRESKGQELDSVENLCRFAESIAFEMRNFFPEQLQEKLAERKGGDYYFYHMFGKYWNEVPLPEIVQILFNRFCELAGAENQGTYVV